MGPEAGTPRFTRIGRFYGVWGRSVGFVPDAATTSLDPAVALEIEARLARWVNWRLNVLRRGMPAMNGMAVRRRGDGVTAFGLGPEHAARIVRWSEAAAARKRARGAGRVGPEARDGSAGAQPLSTPWTSCERRCLSSTGLRPPAP